MRERALKSFRENGVRAVFHYVPLHSSPKGMELCGQHSLPVTEDLSARLVRLPFFHEIDTAEQNVVINILSDVLRQFSTRRFEQPV
jgi:dTDP-4-amino-4,6-dideoxygalactose transaminase